MSDRKEPVLNLMLVNPIHCFSEIMNATCYLSTGQLNSPQSALALTVYEGTARGVLYYRLLSLPYYLLFRLFRPTDLAKT